VAETPGAAGARQGPELDDSREHACRSASRDRPNPTRSQQILVQSPGNAIKFTRERIGAAVALRLPCAGACTGADNGTASAREQQAACYSHSCKPTASTRALRRHRLAFHRARRRRHAGRRRRHEASRGEGATFLVTIVWERASPAALRGARSAGLGGCAAGWPADADSRAIAALSREVPGAVVCSFSFGVWPDQVAFGISTGITKKLEACSSAGLVRLPAYVIGKKAGGGGTRR